MAYFSGYMVRPLLFILLLTAFSPAVFPQEKPRKADWLPSGNLFPSLRFDLHEAQTSGALYAFWADGDWQDQSFANFSAGFRRNLVRLQHRDGMQSEFGMELCVFTQFLFEEPFKTFVVNFFDVEFKVGATYQYKLNDRWSFRARFYHLSAHLGDDYIFRYRIDSFMNNRRIYEMLDFTAAWRKGPWMAYGNAGCIVHSTYERSPLVLEAGGQWNPGMKNKKWVSWLIGLDARFEQQGGFRPCIHTGAGVVLGKPQNHPITIMADYYYGWLPYSLYDKVLVQWIGASMYFDLF
jgi:hypothetical protein